MEMGEVGEGGAQERGRGARSMRAAYGFQGGTAEGGDSSVGAGGVWHAATLVPFFSSERRATGSSREVEVLRRVRQCRANTPPLPPRRLTQPRGVHRLQRRQRERRDAPRFPSLRLTRLFFFLPSTPAVLLLFFASFWCVPPLSFAKEEVH